MPDTQGTPELGQILKKAMRRGRKEVLRAAEEGRSQLEMRRVSRDLENFWVRLGKIAHQLERSGEVSHPEIRRACERIDALEARLTRIREGAEE